jgi:hypothetical protein
LPFRTASSLSRSACRAAKARLLNHTNMGPDILLFRLSPSVYCMQLDVGSSWAYRWQWDVAAAVDC